MSSADAAATRTRRRPTRRTVAAAKLAGITAAVALSGAIVAQASYSAYSASTDNPVSNWAAGTVSLSDDDADTAAFTATNLKPGATGTRCIVVTSSGSLASAVRLYATNPVGTNGLASYVDVSITQGTGGSFGSCTGFTPLAGDATLYTGPMDRFAYFYNSYATGLGTWTPTGNARESRTFQLTYAVDPNAPDSTQNGMVSAGLTWEAQNN